MPEAGTVAAARAYGGIEAGRLVVLTKPLPSGAGYHQQPFAVVRFQDLPEELRRQIAGAARPRDPNAALPPPPVAAPPLRGEGDARWCHAAPVRVDVVPEEGLLRHQLPGLVSVRANDEPTVEFAGDGVNKDYSERRRIRMRLMEEDGKVVVCLDASRLQGLADMDGSMFQNDKGFSATQRAAHAYMGAVYDNGLPVVVALLLDSCSEGVASPREDAVPFVGNGGATEQGAYYDDVDVLLPPPENVVAAAEALRAPCPPTYAVQVWVDAAAGGKAGDPIAAGGVKAAGREHGGSLSAVLGIVVASSAATALAAGTVVAPATAFGLFTALVGGLSLAMASVRAR